MDASYLLAGFGKSQLSVEELQKPSVLHVKWGHGMEEQELGQQMTRHKMGPGSGLHLLCALDETFNIIAYVLVHNF